jgi:hypothetical protein
MNTIIYISLAAIGWALWVWILMEGILLLVDLKPWWKRGLWCVFLAAALALIGCGNIMAGQKLHEILQP